MKWYSTENKLPEHDEIVLVYAGNYTQSWKYDICRFVKGISIEDRKNMKAGLLPNPEVGGYVGNISWPSKRSQIYCSEDEWSNNLKPYCWTHGAMTYFGQCITYWTRDYKK